MESQRTSKSDSVKFGESTLDDFMCMQVFEEWDFNWGEAA